VHRRKAPGVWFVLGFLLLQAAWFVTVPPFRGSDEIDHAYRAAGVATGQWRLSDSAEEGRGKLVRVPSDLVEAAAPQCEALDYMGPANCVGRAVGPAQIEVGTGAGNYNPVFYAAIGFPSELATGAGRVYVMRLVTALWCGLLLLGAASRIPRAASWLRSALVLAVSPVAAYSMIVAAPNGVEIAAAIALWCALMALLVDGAPTRSSWWIAVIAGATLATLRLLGPLFLALICLTVLLLSLRAPREGWRPRRIWRRLVDRCQRWELVAGASIVCAAVTAASWWILTAGQTGTGGDFRTQKLTEEDLAVGAGDWVLWQLQTIAAFPFRDQVAPLSVYAIVLSVVVAMLVLSVMHAARAISFVVALSLLGAILLPLVLTLVTRSSQGVIWQGRYGLPYSVGFILMAGLALEVGRQVLELRWVPLATCVALGVASFLSVRHVVHLEGARSVSSQDSAWWTPPVGLLAGLVLVSTALFMRWVASGEAVDRNPHGGANRE